MSTKRRKLRLLILLLFALIKILSGPERLDVYHDKLLIGVGETAWLLRVTTTLVEDLS